MQWQNPRFFPYINLLMFYIYCTQIGNKIRPKLPYIKTLIILLKNKQISFCIGFSFTLFGSRYILQLRVELHKTTTRDLNYFLHLSNTFSAPEGNASGFVSRIE